MSGAATGPVGRRFGAYVIQGEIASGGQGAVWRALHQPSGQSVALKLLLGSDASAVKRFRQEARVLARLSHPHVLRVLDHGEANGVPYLATELIDGDDLAAYVKSQGIPPFAWTARVLATVAGTLQHCHEQGVVHRDLKPANILIERGSGRPVLVDFGLVKRDAEQMQLASLDGLSMFSKSGAFKGTPEYMAPEQVNEKKFGQVSPRTDVYGLGATLFHLLTGQPPFTAGASAQPAVVMRKVTRKAPPDPCQLNPQVPEALGRLCLQCLAKPPQQRPTDAAAVMRALMQIAGPSDTRPDTSAGVTPPPPTGVQLPGAIQGLAGSRLGPFTVLSELGRGGMGVVFKAQRDDGTLAAVKVLANVVIGASGVKRFSREAKALADLDHPNVVRFLGASATPPLWIAMEFVEGGDLSDYLMKIGVPAFEDTARIVAEVAEGIAHAHERGLMHRDLKPGNVLLTKDARAVVTDFGMAKSLESSRFTQTGAMVGTLAFMPPEQATGDRNIGFPADVWAIGAVLYRCLAGTNPFDADSSIGLVGKIMEGTLRPPRRWNPDVPDDLQATCLACLQRDPDLRPSAAEVARALRERRGLSRTEGGARLPRGLVIGAPLSGLVVAALALIFTLGGAPEPADSDPPAEVVESPQTGVVDEPGVDSSGGGDEVPPANPWPAAREGWRATWSAKDGGGVLGPKYAWPAPDTADPLASARAAAEGAQVEGFFGEAVATRGGRVRVRYSDPDRAFPRAVMSPGDFFNQCTPPVGDLQPGGAGEASLLAPNDSSEIVLGVGVGRWSDARLDLRLRWVEHVDQDQVSVSLGVGSRALVRLTLQGRSKSAKLGGASVPYAQTAGWEALRLAPGDEAARVRVGETPVEALVEAVRAHGPGGVEIRWNEAHAAFRGLTLEGRPLRPDRPAEAQAPGALPGDARVLGVFEREGEGLGGPFVSLGGWGQGHSLEIDGAQLVLRRGVEILAAAEVPEAASGWLLLERRGDLLLGRCGHAEEAFEVEAHDPLSPQEGSKQASYGSTAPRVRFERVEVHAGPSERDDSDAVREWQRGARLLARASVPALAEPNWRGPEGRAARRRAGREASDALDQAALGLSASQRLDALARAVLGHVVAADGARAADSARRLIEAAGLPKARERVDGLRYSEGQPALLKRFLRGYTNVMDVEVRDASLLVAAELSPPDAPRVWVELAASVRNRSPRPDPNTPAGRAAFLGAIELLERARQAGYPATDQRLDGFQAEYLMDLNRPAEALTYFDKVVATSKNWWHWMRRAQCLEALGRPVDALESSLGALAYAPGRPQLHGFVAQQAQSATSAETLGVVAAAVDAVGTLAKNAGLQENARGLAQQLLQSRPDPRQADLAVFVLARGGDAPPIRPGDRPTALLLRARLGDADARRGLRAAAASDPLVRHLALLDVELAPLLR